MKYVFIVILSSNLLVAPLGFAGWGKAFKYSSKDCSFTFTEQPLLASKLSNLENRAFVWRGNRNCETGDYCKIYRTFEIEPLKFWLWAEYIFHPRWEYEYLPQESLMCTTNNLIN